MIPTGCRVLYGGDTPRQCLPARRIADLTDGMKVFVDLGDTYVEADVVARPGSTVFLESIPEDTERDGDGSEYFLQEDGGFVEVSFGHSRAAIRELTAVLAAEIAQGDVSVS